MGKYRWVEKFRSGGRFYKRSLVLVLCLASLPAAVMGMASYYLGVTHIEREVAGSRSVLLAKTAARLDTALGQLELAASQLSLDPRLEGGLQTADFSQEYSKSYELFRFLGLMKSAYPLLSEAELYLDQGHLIRITDTGGIERFSDPNMRKRFQDRMGHKQRFFWDDPLPADPEQLELVHKLPDYGKPYGLLVLRLDRGKLKTMVQDSSLEEGGISLLIRDAYTPGQAGAGLEAEPVSGSLASAAISRARAFAGMQAVPSEGGMQEGSTRPAEGARSVRFKWEGDTYSLTSIGMSRLGERWTYLTAAPLSSLTMPVILLSRSLLAVSLAGLLLAGILAWLGSRRLYRPISRLVSLAHEHRQRSFILGPDDDCTDAEAGSWEKPEDVQDEMAFLERGWRTLAEEQQVLREELRRSYPELRSSMFMQLAQGHFRGVGEDELLARLSAFGWKLDKGTRIAGLLLQVGQHGGTDAGSSGVWQEPLMTFAAANVAGEYILEQGMQAEIVNFQDTTVAMLVPCGPSTDGAHFQRRLAAAAGELAATIRGLLKLEAVIAVGSPKPLGELHLQLPLLRGLFSYRDLREECQVLELEALVPGSGIALDYPFDAERELLQAVRLGVEADGLLKRFFAQLAACASKEKLLREGALQLLGSLLHAMREAGYVPRMPDADSPYERVLALKNADAMQAYISDEILGPYMNRVKEQRESDLAVIAGRARDKLESDYAADISLEHCADLCGVSTYTLSRSFKHAFGVNFSDYLASLRISKSKELLLSTDLKVNDVAKAIGYQPSYFNRLFRKLEGMTPGQYRDKGESLN